jgi:hypothetical protein
MSKGELAMALETDEVTADWDGVAPAQKGGGGRKNDGLSLFMKLDPRPGKPYRFRLGCTPIHFRKHRWAFRTLKQWPISPASDIKERDLDVAWSKGKYIPVEGYAAFVFDRENANRLRILEGNRDVYGPIGSHAHMFKINPASPTKGFDWLVEVTEDADGKRQYMVTMDAMQGPTPFTPDEIKALENPKFQRSELETKYFVKSTPEEIKDLWEQLPEPMRVNTPRGDKKGAQGGQKTAQATEQPKAAPAAAPAAAAAPATQAAAPAAKPAAPAAKAEPAPAKDDGFLADPDEAGLAQEGGPSEVGEDEPARLF